ncbi:Ig-like domain-containing protein [Dolichospermum circinale]|uniref:Ig-like domain-containing protein n=1 Tax=Dolichospermum circinale TaxID=109265 RepID=UPI00232B7DF0|nr:Ig-like domain-containing protein [Dolichospermum circinale]MDB9455574.1 Ig-like domain-containing protein [Dolichospermum circinale CS-541/06]MDB9461663.1 Ig-like domain-containing protein [Dolichospermum circinale CS-541/04]MDB9547821.1 Ig-like domain-containing protein [Dolichospermum circinale CS-1031]
MSRSYKFIQPLDGIAIALMLLLSMLIGLIIWKGDVVKPIVRNFTWEKQQIGADDISFSLNFSRPMDIKSVEENLKIDPPLAGKISWAGRRMVYTLLTPAPYGTTYQVKLEKGRDKYSQAEGKNRVMQPFNGSFTTRDRVILYIGTNQEFPGQLVLYNLTKEQKKVLTPKDLIVMDFEPFPNGEKIVFSARSSQNPDLLSAQIYSVTTGISSQVGTRKKAAGKVDLILDNKEYQNLKFDLSADGETIVIQRGKRDNPGDFALWYLPTSNDIYSEKPTPKRLQGQPGGDFLITPDSKAVAVSQGQGTAIVSLDGNSNKPLDFLPQFGLVQVFSKDGSQAAMVKFNTDYTRDLFLVTNQGVQKQLLKTKGSILSCQFDPASPTLYCLLTQLISQEQYLEQPYLLAIDLKTGMQKPLLLLPAAQRNVQTSLAPDGLGLLFDQVIPISNNTTPLPANTLKTEDGEPIASSSLWLMPLLPIPDNTNIDIKPEQLPLVGFHPHWLP